MNKRRFLAFILSVMIVAESGLTALAAEMPESTSAVSEVTQTNETSTGNENNETVSENEDDGVMPSPTTEETAPETTPAATTESGEATPEITPTATAENGEPTPTPVTEEENGEAGPSPTATEETTPSATPTAAESAEVPPTPVTEEENGEATPSPTATEEATPETTPIATPEDGEATPTPTASLSPEEASELDVLLLNVGDPINEENETEALYGEIQLPKSIAFNGMAKSMVVGQSLTADITITKSYEEDQVKVVFSSSDTDVIRINSLTGEMDALTPGTAEITVAAVDEYGNVSTAKNTCATAKVTVTALNAPTGIVISQIRDRSVTVGWKSNMAIGSMEIYAVPYSSDMGTKADDWLAYIEDKIEQDATGFVVIQADAAASTAELTGLTADTEYVFYLRNTVKNAVGFTVYAGAVSAKCKTGTVIFDNAVLIAKDTQGVEMTPSGEEEALPVFEVKEEKDLPESVSYKLVDADNKTVEAVFTNVSYKSTNAKVVKVDAKGKLTPGGQAGTARIYVTGKDSSGTVRESDGIVIRVSKAPTKLVNKTTKLAVGATVKLTELIKTDVAGTTDQIDFTALDLEAIKTQIEEYDELSLFPSGGEGVTLTTQNAMVRAEETSGSCQITFTLKGDNDESAGSAVATVTLTDMTAPVIKKTVVRDTTAELQLTPSASVTEVAGDAYYYTAELTDNVTGEKLTMVPLTGESTYSGSGYAYRFDKGDTLYTCKLYGLSANKSYTAAVTAHYKESVKSSKAVKFTTQKELLTQGGSIGVRYVALDELRKDSQATGENVDYEDERGIVLENNTTYALFAQVSNLARALETDKLTWAVTAGDKKAATLKVSASTYELQLLTQKTGTFTLTATSKVTKEVVSAFTVTVVPYQSNTQKHTTSEQSELFYYYQGEGIPTASDEEENE